MVGVLEQVKVLLRDFNVVSHLHDHGSGKSTLTLHTYAKVRLVEREAARGQALPHGLPGQARQ